MSDFRTVTEDFSVAPQIGVQDVARAKAEGFELLINNRPDGEADDQAPGAEIAAEAQRLGLTYIHIPIVGGPSREQAEIMHAAVREAQGRVLAFCRSGTRSINAWALGQALAGAKAPGELVELGFGAGYDLRPILG